MTPDRSVPFGGSVRASYPQEQVVIPNPHDPYVTEGKLPQQAQHLLQGTRLPSALSVTVSGFLKELHLGVDQR